MAEKLTREQIMQLAKENNLELSEEQLDAISGGDGLEDFYQITGGLITVFAVAGCISQSKKEGKTREETAQIIMEKFNIAVDPNDPQYIEVWDRY